MKLHNCNFSLMKVVVDFAFKHYMNNNNNNKYQLIRPRDQSKLAVKNKLSKQEFNIKKQLITRSNHFTSGIKITEIFLNWNEKKCSSRCIKLSSSIEPVVLLRKYLKIIQHNILIEFAGYNTASTVYFDDYFLKWALQDYIP